MVIGQFIAYEKIMNLASYLKESQLQMDYRYKHERKKTIKFLEEDKSMF